MITEAVVQTAKEEEPTEKVEPSRYLKHLPAMYSADDFLGRFLRIFEDVLAPVEEIVAAIDYYFDPMLTPPHVLSWLASWLSLVLDEEWPLDKRRQLVGRAVELYHLRGTLQGLTEYLGIYVGVQPVIVEHYGGIQLGEESRLGWNTALGDGQDHCFTVVVRLQKGLKMDSAKVRAIIEAEKPAEAAYNLEIMEEDGQ